MSSIRPDQHAIQYHDLKQIIGPHLSPEHNGKHHQCTSVEGHKIDHVHQSTTLTAEIQPHRLRDIIPITTMQMAQHLLHTHLQSRVPAVDEKEELIHPVSHLLMLCLHLLQRLELSPLILTDEIKVKRLVIVCQIGLRQMREATGKGWHEEPIGTIFMGCTCMCNWVTMLYRRKSTEHCKSAIMENKNYILKMIKN